MGSAAPEDMEPAIARGLGALKRAEWESALEQFRGLQERFPQESRIFIFASEALLGAGRVDEAYENLVPVESRFAHGSPWVGVLLGKLELIRGDVERGIATFREALERFPAIEAIYEVVADTLAAHGRGDEAEDVLAGAARTFPDSVVVHVALARNATIHGWRDTALQRWKTARARFPAAPEVYRGVGESFSRAGRLERAVVAVYGSCQANYLAKLANHTPALAQRFQFVPVLNHAAPGEKVPPVPRDVEDAALVWEQYDERSNLLAREELRARVPTGTRVVTFPPTIVFGLWPFAFPDPRNQPEPGFAFGRYPWGDRIGLEIAKMNLPASDVYDRYMELSRQKMPDVATLIARDRAVAEKRDQCCDVKMADYVFENLRARHLFWTWGHVSNALALELLRRLWRQSEDVVGELTAEAEFELERVGELIPGNGAEQLPIHPDVVRALDLSFGGPDAQYDWFGQRWTFQEYITRYIMLDKAW
jgi:tetratricopeptide (TPR) repeat protein